MSGASAAWEPPEGWEPPEDDVPPAEGRSQEEGGLTMWGYVFTFVAGGAAGWWLTKYAWPKIAGHI